MGRLSGKIELMDDVKSSFSFLDYDENLYKLVKRELENFLSTQTTFDKILSFLCY